MGDLLEDEKARIRSFYPTVYRRALIAGIDQIIHPNWIGECPYQNPKSVRIWEDGVRDGRERAISLANRPTDFDALPDRIPTPALLRFLGYSRATLRARQQAGKMCAPIDRGGRGGIYDKAQVGRALGIAQDETPEPADPWRSDPIAYRDVLARQIRGAQKAGRRNGAGLLPGSGKASALRMVSSDPSAPNGV